MMAEILQHKEEVFEGRGRRHVPGTEKEGQKGEEKEEGVREVELGVGEG